MNRKDKIDLLTKIQQGKAGINDLNLIRIIIAHKDGTFTHNGKPVNIDKLQSKPGVISISEQEAKL